MKQDNDKKRKIFTIISYVIIVIGVAYLGLSAIYYKDKNIELNDKVDFYEKVLDDFGIGEFVNYPELYYDEYVDQAKVHQCMWMFEEKEE